MDRAFERAARSLAADDRRLAQEIAYGVLRLRGRLDHILGALVAGGIGRLDPDVLDLLRMGAYQLLELDRVPAYAAVAEAVEAAKAAKGAGAASLVNAVLRRLSGASYEAFEFPPLERDPVGHLTTWGSHPRWLVERWLERWPPEQVARLVSHGNRRPPACLSVLGDRAEAVERLRAAGLRARAVEVTSASVCLESGTPEEALAVVPAVVQDPSAAAVVDYANLDRGLGVVDLCAAPGGKASLLAGRGHEVWAFDVARRRLERLLENRRRLGLERLHAAVADATRPPVGRAPAVLLDVPCTGTGTLARHPDARWRLGPGDLRALVALQRRMLDAAAEVVAPGGWLIYATCSLEPEENEEQVRSFLARRSEFSLDPAPRAIAAEMLSEEGELTVLPQRHGMDGAYAARLRRRAD